MSIENWMLFVTVCLAASMTPGPGILSVITYSVYHGTRNSIPIILGILSGLSLLSLMAVLGLGLLLESSKTLFIWLQYLGAIYLFIVGIKTFRSKTSLPTELHSKKQKDGLTKLYFQGLGVSMVNPKAIGFFSALFIPFINPNNHMFSQFSILYVTMLGCSTFALFFYAAGAQIVSPVLKKYSSAFNKITGGFFIGLSVMMITSNKT